MATVLLPRCSHVERKKERKKERRKERKKENVSFFFLFFLSFAWSCPYARLDRRAPPSLPKLHATDPCVSCSCLAATL